MGEMVGLGENWELGWKICTANVTCWGQTNNGKEEIIPVEIFPAMKYILKATMMIISPLIKIVVSVKMTIFPCTVARVLSAKRTCRPTPPPSLTQTPMLTPTESQSLP